MTEEDSRDLRATNVSLLQTFIFESSAGMTTEKKMLVPKLNCNMTLSKLCNCNLRKRAPRKVCSYQLLFWGAGGRQKGENRSATI